MGIFVIFEYPHLAKSTIQTTSLTTTLYTNHFENALLNCFYFDDGRLDRRGRGWSYSRSSSPSSPPEEGSAYAAGQATSTAAPVAVATPSVSRCCVSFIYCVVLTHAHLMSR